MYFAAWYALAVGLLILALWTVLLATRQVPELRTAPRSIALHLTAEGLTAVALVATGAGLLTGSATARGWAPAALGMVLYSEVNSAGYYAQARQWVPLAMFGVLAVLAFVALVALVR